MGLIKDAIKRECRKQGLTQVDLAEMCGMKSGNLNNQIGKDGTVQLGLVKKICEKLSISVGSLFDNPDYSPNDQGEELMIFEQLKVILGSGDDDTVDLIVGKITREYVRVTQKKAPPRNQATQG